MMGKCIASVKIIEDVFFYSFPYGFRFTFTATVLAIGRSQELFVCISIETLSCFIIDWSVGPNTSLFFNQLGICSWGHQLC